MIDVEKWNVLAKLFFSIILITSILDIAADEWHGANVRHIVQESVVYVFALSFQLMLFLNTRTQVKQNTQLLIDLNEAQLHLAKASKELVSVKRIFAEEISKQFSDWGLTESESDIALFTLKGFSAKEIANFRNTSEKTVRNQLTSIYKKSETTSKVSFTARFMEVLW